MPFTCFDVAKAALGQPKKQSGDELYYRCPIHTPDKNPSLQINRKKNVWMCGPCAEGGTAWQLAAFLAGLDPSDNENVIAWLVQHGLMEEKSDQRELEATYVYEDEQRRPLFRVERYRTPKGKTFRQSRPDGNGGWVSGVKNVRKVPYHLPDFVDQQVVYIVEGEGVADALWKWDIPATTNPGGAAKHGKWKPEYNPYFQGKQVVSLPDRDPVGEAHMRNVAKHLFPFAKAIKIVHLPGLPEKGDFKDWKEGGGTLEQLREIVQSTPLLTQEEVESWNKQDTNQSSAVLRCAAEVEPKEVEWLWKPYIPLGKMTVIQGHPGVGKSFFALNLAATVSSGWSFPDPETGIPDKDVRQTPRSVLYASVEDAPEDTLVPRLISMEANLERIHFLEGVRRQDPETGEWFIDILSFSNLKEIEEAFERTGCTLAIFDPIQGFGGGANMNHAHEVRRMLAPLAKLAEKHNMAIFLIAHPRKSSTDRALQRISGSADIGAAVRSGLLAGDAPQKNGERAIVHIKSNLAKQGPSLGYAIEDDGRSGRFLWTGRSDLTAEDLLAPDQGPEEQSALDEAIGFLDDTLDEGSVPVSIVKTESEKAGITWTTMKRAKQKMGVKSQKMGGPGTPWCWAKKPKGTKAPIYDPLGPLRDSEAQKEAENPVKTGLFKGDQGSLPKEGNGAVGPLTKDPDSESGWESF